VFSDVDSGHGKAAGFRPGSERETERGTSVREKERDAGSQRGCSIRGDNQTKKPKPEIAVVTSDVGSGLRKTAGFRPSPRERQSEASV